MGKVRNGPEAAGSSPCRGPTRARWGGSIPQHVVEKSTAFVRSQVGEHAAVRGLGIDRTEAKGVLILDVVRNPTSFAIIYLSAQRCSNPAGLRRQASSTPIPTLTRAGYETRSYHTHVFAQIEKASAVVEARREQAGAGSAGSRGRRG
jgi:hypothetical protein